MNDELDLGGYVMPGGTVIGEPDQQLDLGTYVSPPSAGGVSLPEPDNGEGSPIVQDSGIQGDTPEWAGFGNGSTATTQSGGVVNSSDPKVKTFEITTPMLIGGLILAYILFS